MNEKEQATEFQRRRSLPGVTVRMMGAGRTFDVFLSRCGVDLGSKTEITKRGKVVSTLYILPAIEEG